MTIDELHTLWEQTAQPKRKPKQQEHRLQVACLEWLRMAYPNVLCYAIPNGGQRNEIEGKRLKDEGVTAGIPDLHIPLPRGAYASLYIEMKDGKKGRLSDHQKQLINLLQSYGNKVVVCRTIEEFMREVNGYLQPSSNNGTIDNNRITKK